MLVTTLFAKKIISMIESKMGLSFYVPDRFKTTWFESIEFKGEYKKSDCILDEDGFWRSKKMDSGNGKGKDTQYHKFWWRIEPNYSTGGRPCYNSGVEQEIYNKSEKSKVILSYVKSQICLEWEGFDPPTETCWGLRMRMPYVTIYENGRLIYKNPFRLNQKGWKKDFMKFVDEYYNFSNRDL